MAGILDINTAIASCIPRVDSWDYYINQEPETGKLPPWVIATITSSGRAYGEALTLISGTITITLRVAAHSIDAVNVLCDDHLIPGMQGITPHADGVALGSFIINSDSGTYRAGLTASDTALRYAVRVLTFTITWSIHA